MSKENEESNVIARSEATKQSTDKTRHSDEAEPSLSDAQNVSLPGLTRQSFSDKNQTCRYLLKKFPCLADGVDWKTLGEVCEMQRGTSITKAQSNHGDIPVISGGREPAFYCDKSNRNGETITVAGSGASAGYVQYWNEPIYVNDAFSIKGNEKLETKFVYYCLTNMQEEIYRTKKGGGVPHVHISSIENFLIPLPPLPVQQEIVRILDKFTELEKELEKELVLRRKQYEYYRDKLISEAKGAEWKTLGEVATSIYRGSGIRRDQVTEKGIPCVRYGEIYTTYHTFFDKCVSHTVLENVPSPKYFEHGDLLFAITGENVADIAKTTAYVGNEKCLAGGDIVVLKHNQNPKYLSYALATADAVKQKGFGKSKNKVVHSSVPDIAKIKLPVPPLSEQTRIVQILDKFESLTNSLTSGIPAEIKLRKKQYEYYRDLLLTFKHA